MYQCIAYEIIICNNKLLTINNNIYFDNVSEYRKTSQGSALHPYGRMALHHLQVSLNLCPEGTKGKNVVAFADTLPANESKLAACCSMVEFWILESNFSKIRAHGTHGSHAMSSDVFFVVILSRVQH